MKQNYTNFVFFLILFFSTPIYSMAHNGTTDELGGHFRSNDCMYLLHEPTSLAKTAKNLQELAILIQKYNGNRKCKLQFDESKIDLEGNSFSSSLSNPSSKANQKEHLAIRKRYVTTLEKCTDGDTASFKINDITYKTRFLYIDTPESTNSIEPFGKQASEFTCGFLKSGSITLETDGNELFDKYNRLLAWVWVDDKLLQEEIAKAGLVEDFYDYGDYK